MISATALIKKRMNEIGFQAVFGVDASKILGSSSSITPAMFQMIVGVYLIEVIMILAIFVTKINRGEDSVSQWYLAAKMLMIGMTFYAVTATASSIMFGDIINQALSTIGG